LGAGARERGPADQRLKEKTAQTVNVAPAVNVLLAVGLLGAHVCRRTDDDAFGCDIGYFARHSKADSRYRFFDALPALAEWADVLVVTVAGGAGTRDLIGAETLEALGPDGIFINLSRGSTVDESALLAALETGTIKAAGLDVFQNEPRIDPRFLALQNVVLQPHHGSGTVETRKAMGQLVRDNLAAHFAGTALLTPVT